jgi:ribonuclease E
MHLAPTASRRVYQQRIGRIMRTHPRKEAGVVVDFVDPAATHTEKTVTVHSLLDADFYRPGARVTPAPRRRVQRRARRKLSPAAWLIPVTPDPRRRVLVIQREWERVDPGRLADDEQLLWARIAGRQLRFDERQQFAEKLAKASRDCREAFLTSCASENPNRRLRLSALGDRVAISVDRASFDDLVSMVTSAPTWDKDRVHGVRVLLRALGSGKVEAPEDILARWTWRLARATRKLQDRRASAELPEAKRLLGALTNSRGHRHEENAARLVNVALEQPVHVGVALLASAEAYTPTAQRLTDGARERLASVGEVANALADNLPAAKQPSGKSRRRRRRKKRQTDEAKATAAHPGGGDGARPDGGRDAEPPSADNRETSAGDGENGAPAGAAAPRAAASS